MQSLLAQMEADRNLLAQRILSKLSGASSSSGSGGVLNSSSSTASTSNSQAQAFKGQGKKARQQLRPSSLGVGAALPEAQARPGASSLAQDVRLKGRLTSKKRSRDHDDGDSAAPAMNGKANGQVPEMEDDAEGSRAEGLASEGKAAKKRKGKGKDVFAVAATKLEKQKSSQGKPDGEGASATNYGSTPAINQTEQQPQGLSKSKLKKLRKKAKAAASAEQAGETSAQLAQSADDAVEEAESPKAVPQEPSHSNPPNPPTSLTPLQARMSTSLSGARFRSINEKLYTSTSLAALNMMQKEPHMMQDYHEGFASQTLKWPVNPVHKIASMLREMDGISPNGASSKKQKKENGKGKERDQDGSPLLIVDLGAGTAPLAKELLKTPRVGKVLSYDLLTSEDGFVVGCDVGTSVPLPGRKGGPIRRSYNASRQAKDSKDLDAIKGALLAGPEVADVALFSLSLMGTNWVDMVIEARRILKLR